MFHGLCFVPSVYLIPTSMTRTTQHHTICQTTLSIHLRRGILQGIDERMLKHPVSHHFHIVDVKYGNVVLVQLKPNLVPRGCDVNFFVHKLHKKIIQNQILMLSVWLVENNIIDNITVSDLKAKQQNAWPIMNCFRFQVKI